MQVHIYNVSVSIVQRFRLTVEEVDYTNFVEGMDGQTDGRTEVKHNALNYRHGGMIQDSF